MAVELLLLNGAKLNKADIDGKTPLHHATILKNLKYSSKNNSVDLGPVFIIEISLFRMVCLLLKRGANPLAVDKNGVDPIVIATENCQANIVTM